MPVSFQRWIPQRSSNSRRYRAAADRRRFRTVCLIAAAELLEERLLLSGAGLDDDSEVDVFGNEYHTVGLPDAALSSTTTGNFDGTGTLLPYSQTFLLHSSPGATHTIYLDFDGHVTSGTTWNAVFTGGASIVTPAFDFESGASVFTNNELARIQYIWQRVAEDFLPFNVNVTTQDPGAAALSKSGGGDTAWGIRVAIGGDSADWYSPSVGGVAYIGSFNWSSDAPVFVFAENLGDSEKYVAEAVSHEVGHALGLGHDGTSSTGYYQGSGSGATGWAPIMGVGYYRELTTWSRGEYSGANNTEDDLAKITANNGFGYRGDDYGNSATAAGSLVVSGTSVTGSGIIESAPDRDVFVFTTAAGTVSFSVTQSNRGANLDVLAELYDSGGNLVASDNPSALLSANFSVTVGAGTYYLQVSGVGNGSPTSGGYSDYASIGAYRISGTVATAPTVNIAGDYIFLGGGARIVQNGSSLTFYNEHGNSAAGYFLNSTQVVATGWGNLVGTISGTSILWANGSTWIQGTAPSIAGTYTFNGGTARVVQSGSTLTFINEHGNSANGVFTDSTHVRVSGWGNLIGTISGSNIVWANGGTWVRSTSTVISGYYSFSGLTTRVLQSGTSLTFINEHGNTSAGTFIDSTHVRATGWGNLVGTLNGSRIDWGNGTSWVLVTAAAPAVDSFDAEFAAAGPVEQPPGSFSSAAATRGLRLDSLQSDLESVSTATTPSESPTLVAAPIDVDEVFAAFGALQSSMDEAEAVMSGDSADRPDGFATDAVEQHAAELLDFALELVSSRDLWN